MKSYSHFNHISDSDIERDMSKLRSELESFLDEYFILNKNPLQNSISLGMLDDDIKFHRKQLEKLQEIKNYRQRIGLCV